MFLASMYYIQVGIYYGAGHLVTATFVQWQKSGDEALPYIVIPASWRWKCEFGSEHNILIILGSSFEPLSYPHSHGFTGAL